MATTDNVKLKVTAIDKASGTLNSVHKKVLAIGAAYLSWRAVTAIIGSVIEKGKESEKAWTDVTAALERHGIEVDTYLPKIRMFADEMQTLAGISDETIGKAAQTFIDYGQSADEAMKTVRVAMDLAAGGGMDFAAATDLLAKAAVGYTGTLSRYGIIIDENIPKSEKFAAAIEQINDRFAGATAARADTFAGRIDVLSKLFGDLQEKMFFKVTQLKKEWWSKRKQLSD